MGQNHSTATIHSKKPLVASKPLYVRLLAGLRKIGLLVYEAMIYIPSRFFAAPDVKPLTELDNDKSIINEDTPAQILPVYVQENQVPVVVHGPPEQLRQDSIHLESRDICEVLTEARSAIYTYEKYILKDYPDLTYRETEAIKVVIGCGLSALNANYKRRVVIYAESRKDYILTAYVCNLRRIPVVAVYASLSDKLVAAAMSGAVIVITTPALLLKVKPFVKDARFIICFDTCHITKEAQPVPVINEFNGLGIEVFTFERLRSLVKVQFGYTVKDLDQPEDVSDGESCYFDQPEDVSDGESCYFGESDDDEFIKMI